MVKLGADKGRVESERTYLCTYERRDNWAKDRYQGAGHVIPRMPYYEEPHHACTERLCMNAGHLRG
jgi:hypothetical protein